MAGGIFSGTAGVWNPGASLPGAQVWAEKGPCGLSL